MLLRATRRIAQTLGFALVSFIALSATAWPQSMRLHFIDVGQGASTLIEFPCAAVLIDTGGESNEEFDSTAELSAYLQNFFAQRPDLHQTFHSLILTHPHIDHTRGVPTVIGRYKILNAVTNGQEDSSGGAQQKALHQKISDAEGNADPSDDIGFVAAEVNKIPKNKGLTNSIIDPVKCPTVDPKITVLWGASTTNPGWTQTVFKNANNHSVVVRVDFGASSFLDTGDLEEDAIANLLEHYQGSSLLKADVYEVGHHGSANGTTEALLQAVSPKMAVMEMGPPTRELMWTAWKYGHPRKSTIDLLETYVGGTRSPVTAKVATAVSTFVSQRIDRAIYGTGWDGSLILEADTNGAWKQTLAAQGPQAAANAPQAAATDRVDVNAANVSELTTLPRIGPVRAQAIVDYRTRNGRFRSIDDLGNVKGIGPATLLEIRDHVTVGTGN
jgi:competence protein ComEC